MIDDSLLQDYCFVYDLLAQVKMICNALEDMADNRNYSSGTDSYVRFCLS
jgi:hypothetical protein